ncbi:MAG: hypothetical protein HOG05_01300 [Bacteroidetes bacterium]|jgi:hypothetical protein|nr:hypothetical protein [Bacteroidota bacterium]MBT3422609.1 hypothetical protein [Bacteroidota bacterium]MBT3799764.1 hypothetical protein [Bacteroidota bacterium]MBT4967452.1 hypothetical protein [Bacteroidota bacterium]MBT5991179.1 hypothetical protein [Bacteroidota bacterium]
MKKSDLSVFKTILFMAVSMILMLFIGWLIIPRLAAISISSKADLAPINKMIEKSDLEREESIELIENITYRDLENALLLANDTMITTSERKSVFINSLIQNQDIAIQFNTHLSDKQFMEMLDKINTNKKLIPLLIPSFKNLLIKQVENYYDHENQNN